MNTQYKTKTSPPAIASGVSLPVIARNEAIQAQATAWIASFLAMTGEIQCTKISRVKSKLRAVRYGMSVENAGGLSRPVPSGTECGDSHIAYLTARGK
ncbi:MAG: hypothetical protein LBJ47_06770, partial [Tannerella sp.]|nr:hypothetical protein [Tannerella sp.]